MTPKSKASLKRRLRRVQKFLSNLSVTVICGLITILVIKGGGVSFSFGNSSERPENHNRLLMEAIAKGQALPKQRQMVKLREEGRVSRGSSLPKKGSEEPRLVLMSGTQPELCQDPRYTTKILNNKAGYCGLHNIHFFPNATSLRYRSKSQFNSSFFSNVPQIHSFMVSHPNLEWIWWLDSLTLITDMSFPLPMDKYKHHDFVLHGCGNQPCDLANFALLNISSIFIRNSKSSLQLLHSFMSPGSTSSVLATKSSLKDLVYVEDSKHFFGFWVQVVDQIERNDPGFGDDRWPFLTHFGGCNMCTSHGDHSLSRCVTHMDTALKYGYNQVKAYE